MQGLLRLHSKFSPYFSSQLVPDRVTLKLYSCLNVHVWAVMGLQGVIVVY